MSTERRQLLLLAVMVVVLVTAVYEMWPATSGAPAAASNREDARGGPAGPGRASTPAAPDVHLEALDAEHPKPGAVDRDLFRFRAAKAPPPQAPAMPPPPSHAPETPAPPAVPSVPPIALKFIGIIESPSQPQKIAVLSDGRGAPFYGKEGDVVEGRYRILKIGVESIEIAYADGRGRQTIRLTGQ
jgi:hypothetical protein